jgi:hypothetical protein
MVYDPVKVVLINTSPGSFSLEGLTFRRIDSGGNETARIDSAEWQAHMQMSANTFKALSSNYCAALETEQTKSPPACAATWRFVTSQAKFYFWKSTPDSGRFEVWRNGTLLQTCDIAAGQCTFHLPSS